MKPAPFAYRRAASLTEAVDLLAADPDAKVIAGGQSLVPMLNMRLARPGTLVDIGALSALDYVDLVDGHLEVGATATQADVAAHPLVRERLPILAAAISRIGHSQIRNRGTVCGSIAHHDPSAELPALALALDARILAYGPRGPVVHEAASFFTGTFDTALAPDEIVTAVQFPLPAPGTGWAFEEVARRSGDFALVGCAALLRAEAGTVAEARLALFGVASTPVRLPEAEALLTGGPATEEAFDEAARLAAASLTPSSDSHASADYRREVAAHLLGVALADALARSTDA
ncbi:xanthine dehydrogenase family protein subunit M [Actinocorallia sp. A-T 12471]|uniref:FAD binding domain-containing protein n=1 Tax=Actinocorallia sp. A-T 12471 TaxID=3089813 RepID=UPI0029D24A45|nr:xanthine dehydrogenase family protein subunit M [Actinocorallia sp. A-T 12471]MDX6739586.1 xanthine dehydrogenase family protein subunit M [Actinocorallia sp. A-T 12471]